MVGKTGRKCSSQGINVIAGGSKCMEDLYKAALPQKSSKFDRYIHYIVPAPTRGYKIWDWVYLGTGACSLDICRRSQHSHVAVVTSGRCGLNEGWVPDDVCWREGFDFNRLTQQGYEVLAGGASGC